VLVGGGVLGICAVGDPEHLIAGTEACDVVADRDDSSGDIGPWDRMLGPGDPVASETDQVGRAGDEVGDTSVDASCMNLDQHPPRRRDLWPVDGAQLQHLGRAVSVLNHRTHRQTLAHRPTSRDPPPGWAGGARAPVSSADHGCARTTG
jgi:hypothetical protein